MEAVRRSSPHHEEQRLLSAKISIPVVQLDLQLRVAQPRMVVAFAVREQRLDQGASELDLGDPFRDPSLCYRCEAAGDGCRLIAVRPASTTAGAPEVDTRAREVEPSYESPCVTQRRWSRSIASAGWSGRSSSASAAPRIALTVTSRASSANLPSQRTAARS